MHSFSLGPDHWQSEELLARYVELLMAGQDAASTYPDVAAHLRQCPICRDTLSDLLSQPRHSDDLPDQIAPSAIPAVEEAASRHRDRLKLNWSHQFSFSLFAPLDAGVMRSAERSYQQGETQLLYYGNVEIQGQKYLAMFTFEQATAKSGRIIGEIAGVDPVPAMAVDLDLPSCISTTTAHNGKIIFDNIPVMPEAVSASITIRSL